MSVFLSIMSVHHMHAVPEESEKGIKSPEGTVGYERPCGCWDSNLGP